MLKYLVVMYVHIYFCLKYWLQQIYIFLLNDAVCEILQTFLFDELMKLTFLGLLTCN